MTEENAYDQVITKTITIHASPAKVWTALTEPHAMQKWMSETEIEIITDWKEGAPMIIRGPWYKTHFENKGTVLLFEPEQALQYSHLSSLSRLPDTPANYTVIGFSLTPGNAQTILELTLNNFPTEAIYRHFNFYWNVTLHLLKKYVEDPEIRVAP